VNALAGVYYFDTSVDARGRVLTAAAAMPHRGSAAVWADGAVALAQLGSMPRRGVATLPSGHRVVADARIDNRAEVLARLGIHPSLAPTDAELIGYAYLGWGRGCADVLVGDFAFAVWNPQERSVFCARDPMGVRPLYYHASDRLFAFATEIRALVALPDVGRHLDATRIADYVLGMESDREYTFRTDVRRLPAAHDLQVTPSACRIRRYWSPEPRTEVRFADDGAYADAFRELFLDAVRVRMDTAGPVAASLSGGVDSSSVVCAARRLCAHGDAGLHSISVVFPDLPAPDLARIDERSFVDLVVRDGGLTPHYVRGDQRSPLGDVLRILPLLEEPYGAPNLYLHWAMYEAAAGAGATVFLDGFDGDTAVSHGLARLNSLLLAGDERTFTAEAHAFARRRGIDARGVLGYYGLPYLSSLARRGRWRAWHRIATAFHRDFGVSRVAMLRDQGLAARRYNGSEARWRGPADLLRPGVARDGSSTPVSAAAMDGRAAHVAGLSMPLYQGTLELANRCAAAFGVDPRYPFFDRRLIEFCIAIPEEQKFADGWTRLVQRRAMQGILPEPIQWRTTKSNLTPGFLRGLAESDVTLLGDLDFSVLDAFVDGAVVTRMRNAWLDHARTGAACHDDPLLLFRLATLAMWMQRAVPDTAVGAAPVIDIASAMQPIVCEVA
jgi:asparagine synthase (glutamine-hydrolysing)